MAFLFKLKKLLKRMSNLTSNFKLKALTTRRLKDIAPQETGYSEKKNADVALKGKKSRPGTGRQKTGNDSTLLLLVSTSSRCLCVIQNAVKAVSTLGVPCILN